MHLKCPHCEYPIEVVESIPIREIVCDSCGSSFSLDELRTASYVAPTPPFRKAGRFELTELLGEGAFGSVWRARDPDLGRIVAVKVPRPRAMGDRESEERFLREARAAANLKHEGIVTVHEVGRQDDAVYIVSDFIEGLNLAEWLSGQRPGFRDSAEIVLQIAEALDHAHRQGVIHRDLKPANIMLEMVERRASRAESQTSGSGPSTLSPRPKIMDFGLAKRDAAEITITRDGRFLGTPAYMSPEQARGESHRADVRSDVYSLGVILYELLTGERPFRGVERMILHQVLHDEPRPLRRLNDRIPRDLETIALKCLAKEPGRRYRTAAELRDDLQRYLNGEPILARPVFRSERLWRWSKRHPAAASAVAAVLTGLISTSILLLALWQTNQRLAVANVDLKLANAAERQATEQAESKRQEAENARQLEQQAREQEERARTRAEAVSQLLINAFRSPDPERDGRRITVVETLDRAVSWLDPHFPNDPLIKADLLNAIGQTYFGLGLAQDSIETHQRALDLRRQLLHDDDADVLASMNNLAAAYSAAGQHDKALPLKEDTLKRQRSKLGPDHRDTLTAMNNLAGTYFDVGQFGEATTLWEETLRRQRSTLGPDHPETIGTMNNLGWTYSTTGSLSKALPLLKETFERFQERLGPDHPHTLASMHNLALAYRADRQLDRALPLLEKALERKRESLGEDHRDTLQAMNSFAVACKEAGELDKALSLLGETLKRQQQKLPPDHPDTLTSMSNLAMAYKAAGKLTLALPLFEETVTRQQNKLGHDHPDTLISMLNLAGGYAAANELEKTAETLRECLGRWQGRFPDDWWTFFTQAFLGSTLAQLKQFEEAQTALLDGYGGLQERAEKIPPNERHRLDDVLSMIVQLYEAWEKPEPAQQWRAKREEAKASESKKP